MGRDWATLSLREAGVALIDCDHRTPPASETGYPYVAIPQLRHGHIDLSDVRRITPKNFAEWTRKAKPAPHDVVLSRRCNPGETAYVPPGLDFALGQNLVFLRADGTKVYPPFLRWLVRGPEWWEQIAKFLNVGAVFDSLKCADVPNFRLRIPPPAEQRAIAHILGTLDDKIELNRRTNETLESMARALFKSWFVDFDPVRAKMHHPSPSGRGAGGEGTTSPGRANAPVPAKLLDFARQLRGEATDAERLLWRLLRSRQVADAKFRRQHPFPPYILDFYCHELKLAIELDGGEHDEAHHRSRDARRDQYLAERGIRVLRFWNNDVLRETEAVLEAIYAAVVDGASGIPSPPAPLPEGEGSKSPSPAGRMVWDEAMPVIPPHIFDLFPARLVDSELGEIPEGWEVGTLAHLSALNPEVWTKQTRPAEIVYVDLSNTKWGRIEAVTVLAAADAPSRAQRVLRQGDTIIGTVRPGNGSYALVSESGLTGSTGFAVLRPNEPHYALFVYLAATAAESIDALAHLADGGAYPAVRPDVVAATPVVCPDSEVLRRFSLAAGSLLAKIAHNEGESRTLAALRDALLPKLISGELRVAAAEKILENAV